MIKHHLDLVDVNQQSLHTFSTNQPCVITFIIKQACSALDVLMNLLWYKHMNPWSHKSVYKCCNSEIITKWISCMYGEQKDKVLMCIYIIT